MLGHAVLVGRERVRPGEEVFELPEWAQDYLRLLDAAGRFAPITAAEALHLLGEARRLRAEQRSSEGTTSPG